MSRRIPIKTELGLAELVPGQRKLSQRYRTVLFCVDGKRNERQVRQMILQAGTPLECFDELLAEGLIRFLGETPSTDFSPLGDGSVDLFLPMNEQAASAKSEGLPKVDHPIVISEKTLGPVLADNPLHATSKPTPTPTQSRRSSAAPPPASLPRPTGAQTRSGKPKGGAPPQAAAPEPQEISRPVTAWSDFSQPATPLPAPAVKPTVQKQQWLESALRETFHVAPDPDSTGFDSLVDESARSPLFVTPDKSSAQNQLPPISLRSAPAVAAPDGALEDARQILIHLVKTEAPVSGEPTLLHLARVQTKVEMLTLLPEVEWRISKPHRALTIAHTMRLVRQLLSDDELDLDGMEEE
jgi:hypothetical protein